MKKIIQKIDNNDGTVTYIDFTDVGKYKIDKDGRKYMIISPSEFTIKKYAYLNIFIKEYFLKILALVILIIAIILLSGCGSYLDGKYPNPMYINGYKEYIDKGNFKGESHLSSCKTDDFILQALETSQFIEADIDLSQCDFWGSRVYYNGETLYGQHLIFFDRITNRYWYGINAIWGGALPSDSVKYYWISEINEI